MRLVRRPRASADSERELAAATQRRDSINAQLANVRQMLATLSGGVSMMDAAIGGRVRRRRGALDGEVEVDNFDHLMLSRWSWRRSSDDEDANEADPLVES